MTEIELKIPGIPEPILRVNLWELIYLYFQDQKCVPDLDKCELFVDGKEEIKPSSFFDET